MWTQSRGRRQQPPRARADEASTICNSKFDKIRKRASKLVRVCKQTSKQKKSTRGAATSPKIKKTQRKHIAGCDGMYSCMRGMDGWMDGWV